MDWVSIAERFGLPLALLMAALWSGARVPPWWYFRSYVARLERDLEKMEHDRDYWRQLALSGTSLAQKATTLASRRAARLRVGRSGANATENGTGSD